MGLYPQKPGIRRVSSDVTGVNLIEGMIVHVSLTPAAVSATGVMAATALTSGAQAGVTAGITSPVIPRNVTIKGNASGNAGNVVVHGTNMNGTAISETIALNGATEVPGSKVFKTVTSVDFPAETHAGTDTTSIGLGGKIGLNHKLTVNTVLAAAYNNVREATDPVVAVSSSAIESNSVLLNTALAGAKVDFWYIV